MVVCLRQGSRGSLASLADTWLIAIRTAITSMSAGLLLRVLFITFPPIRSICFRAPYTSHWRRGRRFDEGIKRNFEKSSGHHTGQPEQGIRTSQGIP